MLRMTTFSLAAGIVEVSEDEGYGEAVVAFAAYGLEGCGL